MGMGDFDFGIRRKREQAMSCEEDILFALFIAVFAFAHLPGLGVSPFTASRIQEVDSLATQLAVYSSR